jgi:hypothetical protein
MSSRNFLKRFPSLCGSAASVPSKKPDPAVSSPSVKTSARTGKTVTAASRPLPESQNPEPKKSNGKNPFEGLSEQEIKARFKKMKKSREFGIRINGISPKTHLNFSQNNTKHPISDPDPEGAKENISRGHEDDLKELSIGLDFGTSTLKAMIWDSDNSEMKPVRFLEAPGIEAYLLPCELYIGKNGRCNLSGEGTEYKSLKLDLLEKPENQRVQNRAAAFLALALQKIRAFYFANNREEASQVHIIWKIQIGLPSSACDTERIKLWENITKAAWLLSLQSPVEIRNAAPCLEKAPEFENTDAIQADDIKAIPEFQAEIYAVVDTSGMQDNSTPYAVIDIGAGTTDIAVFLLTQGKDQTCKSVYIQAAQITEDGLAVLHCNRIAGLQESLCNFAVAAQKITKDEAKQIEDLWAGLGKEQALSPWSSLPDKCSDYLSGAQITEENRGETKTPDTLLWTDFATNIRRTLRLGYKVKHEVIMPTYIIGGGASHKGYFEAARKAVLDKQKISELVTSYPNFNSISRSTLQQIGQKNIWQRLAVAYGLAIGDFGVIEDESMVNVPPLETNKDYRENYIDKDQM